MGVLSRKQLALEWLHGDDFLKCFDEGPPATICTELKKEQFAEIGTLYSLQLRFRDRDREFQMHGVLSQREDHVVTFELLAEERTRLEMVLVGARGESLPYRRRRHTRVPCHLVVHVVGKNGEKVVANTTSLGAGGAFLVLDSPIDVDEELELGLTLMDGRRLNLMGRVTGMVEEGPEPGNSVEFLFRSAAQRDDVADIVAELYAKDAKDKS